MRGNRRPPRPLPVVALADISGSMQPNETEDKIGVLNRCMATMLSSFAGLDSVRGEVSIGVVVFGGTQARIHLPLGLARDARWVDMVAGGRTPMGGAFSLARELLEDDALVPERAFQPMLVLVSDGVPTDDWEQPLDDLLASLARGQGTAGRDRYRDRPDSGRGGRARRLQLSRDRRPACRAGGAASRPASVGDRDGDGDPAYRDRGTAS